MKVSFVVWASDLRRPAKTNALPAAIPLRTVRRDTRASLVIGNPLCVGVGGTLADIVTVRVLYRPQYKSSLLFFVGISETD
jgi:hypothetical protein